LRNSTACRLIENNARTKSTTDWFLVTLGAIFSTGQQFLHFTSLITNTAMEDIIPRSLDNSAASLKAHSQRGFTLLEVMVVVVILGILAVMVVPKIISRPDEARIIAAKQDVASLMQMLKLYRLDNQRYPKTEQGLQALVTKPVDPPVPLNWKTGGYIERLPKDPWGNSYQYLNPGIRGEIDVFSFGADGAVGGEGNDTDIGSWNL
jgi:general secretion pathway protein G